MGKLVETSQWEEDLYQLETGDPVEGGPDGVSNKQAKQLGNRTRYLKQQVEQSQSSLASHVAATDPHSQYALKTDLAAKLAALVGQSPQSLDTLKELADALGNDPNFATTVLNALALKAAIDSPTFTGVPKGTTPPQFDSSTRLATMEALQRALGSFSGSSVIDKATTLTSGHVGQIVELNGNKSFTTTLAAGTSVPPGGVMAFVNQSGVNQTVAVQGNDLIWSYSGGLVSSIVLYPGDTLVLFSRVGQWDIGGGTVALRYVQGATTQTPPLFDNSAKISTTAWYWLQIAAGVSSAGKINGVNGANLLFNGSGEFGASNWSFATNFLPQSDSLGGVGGYFGNTATLSNASGSSFTGNIAVGAGVALTLSFEAISNVSAGNYSVALVAYNSSGTYISNVAAVPVPNGASTSTRYSTSGTTPAGTAYVTVSFNITGVTAPAYGVLWRRAKVEQGNTPSLYSQEANFARVALLDSPAFTGTPIAVTPPQFDSSKRLATTEHVQRASGGVVGDVRNARMYVASASLSATFTADEIVVETSFGGGFFRLAGFNKAVNLGAVGVGGMDAGSAPANGYVALYAIYNPSTATQSLLATNATSSVAPSIYGGGNMPSGYTASALLTVVPTNGSGQFAPVLVRDRGVGIPIKAALTTNTVQSSLTSLSIASAVPPNAVSIAGELSIASTSTSTVALTVASDATPLCQQNATASVGTTGYVANFANLLLSAAQTIYWGSANATGTPTYNIYVTSYTI